MKYLRKSKNIDNIPESNKRKRKRNRRINRDS